MIGRMMMGFGAVTLSSLLPARALSLPVISRMDDQLEPIRKKHDLPALAGAVLVKGKLAAQGAVGVRKVGSDAHVTLHDQFHLGSCTKSMTATLIGMLVEQGKLTWDTTLAQAFPELADAMTPAFRAVTLEHLMAQRSGFTSESWIKGKSFQEMHDLPGTPREQRATYVKAILKEEAAAEPGAKFIYSNRNYAVLGAITERVADKAWEALITERLFHPLGMKSVGFGAMGTPGKLDEPWQHTFSGGQPHPIEPGRYSDNPPVIAPAGTVHCTVEDWTKYVALHLAGENGKSTLLKPETLRHLHTPLFGGEYAGGWGIAQRGWGGGRVFTHAGSNNQNYAVVWMAPLKDFAVVAMTNLGGDTAAKACDEVAATTIQHFLQNG